MKRLIPSLALMSVIGCQNRGQGEWIPIITSAIPSPRLEVWHDREEWSVGMNRYPDVERLSSAIAQSVREPVMITLGKNSSLKENELNALAEKLSADGSRRVFYHQAKGSIDSIERSFEFTR